MAAKQPTNPASPAKARTARTAKAEVPAVVTTAEPAAPATGSYLEWGPVLGGAAVALAVSMLLTQFGAGIGLSAAEDASLQGGEMSWNVLVAGLWIILVALVSASAGGYLAGRMRTRAHDATEDEVEFRDGAHGLVVWAVSGIFAMLAVSVMSALAGLGAAADAETAATATEQALRNAATAGVVFNFASAAGTALAAAGAWFAATTGGAHRDEGTVIHGVVPAYLQRFKRS